MGNFINQLAKSMDSPYMGEDRVLVVDDDIRDRDSLLEGLKSGVVIGSAIVEWEDKTGIMRANVIDFIRGGDIRAYYVKTGDKVEIPHCRVKDGSWRIMY